MDVGALWNSLAWRARFLANPVALLRLAMSPRSPPSALYTAARELPIRDRLRFVARTADEQDLIRLLLLSRIREDSTGDAFFSLDGERFYFCPSGREPDDPDLVEGTLTVLREHLLESSELLSANIDVGPGDVVLDVGSFIGTTSLFFAERVGEDGAVYSFEPLFHELLERNVRANGIEGIVEVVPNGVAEEAGSAPVTISPSLIDSRVVPPDSGSRALEIPVMPLDPFTASRNLERIDFIKLDLEGKEEGALRGAERIIDQFKPSLSIASYHTDLDGRSHHARLVNLLEGFGYRLQTLDEKRIYAWVDD